MSSDYHRRQIQAASADIAKLQQEKGREAGRIADLSRRINDTAESARRSSSASTVNSKVREIARLENDVTSSQKKIANIEEKIAREERRRADAQKSLSREEEQEERERQRKREQEARKHEQRMRDINGRLAEHDDLHSITISAIHRLSELPKQIVVLFLAANPLDQVQLRLDEEARAIGEMIRKSEHRDAVKLESRWAVRPLDVLQAINECKPRIIHFSGHGSNQDQIVFQDDTGHTKVVSKEAIVQVMASASGDIHLVFFNTCYSRGQAEAVVQHIPAAIGMNTTIGDNAARVFSAQFYSAIGFGLSVGRAFQQAKAALMLEAIPEEDTPELFVAAGQNANDLVLVRPPDAPAAAEEL
jgi:hypothetical protein